MNIKEAQKIMSLYSGSIKSDWSKAAAEGVPEYVKAKYYLEAISQVQPLVNELEMLYARFQEWNDGNGIESIDKALAKWKETQ